MTIPKTSRENTSECAEQQNSLPFYLHPKLANTRARTRRNPENSHPHNTLVCCSYSICVFCIDACERRIPNYWLVRASLLSLFCCQGGGFYCCSKEDENWEFQTPILTFDGNKYFFFLQITKTWFGSFCTGEEDFFQSLSVQVNVCVHHSNECKLSFVFGDLKNKKQKTRDRHSPKIFKEKKKQTKTKT